MPNSNQLLQEFLTSSGMSRREFASKVRMTDAALLHWLKGTRTPSQRTKETIERITGGKVPVDSWTVQTV